MVIGTLKTVGLGALFAVALLPMWYMLAMVAWALWPLALLFAVGGIIAILAPQPGDPRR